MTVNQAIYLNTSGVRVVGGVAVTPTTLTSSGGNVAVDAANNPRYELELTEATTELNNPSNLVDGQDFEIVIKQDATGSRALTFGTWWLLTDGITTAVNSTASSVTILRGHAADLPNGPGLRIYFTLEHAGESGGSGDVTGPGSATDTALVRFSGTGGKTIQNSTITLSGTTFTQTTASANLTLLGASSGGAVNLTSGTGSATGAGGNCSITAGDGGATSGNGGAALITAGSADGGGAGGGVTITAGDSTGGLGDPGGSVTILAGGGSAGGGGSVNITAGDEATSGAGGDVVITPGDGTTTQGTVNLVPKTGGTAPELRLLEDQSNGSNYASLKAPSSLTGNTAYVFPTAVPTDNNQALRSATTGAWSWSSIAIDDTGLVQKTTGANLDITAATGAPTQAGGEINITSGTGTAARGGDINIVVGGSTSGDCGDFNVTAGSAAGGFGDLGGFINLTAGDGSGNLGGFIVLKAGKDGTSSAPGGSIYLQPGLGSTPGAVSLVPQTTGVAPELRFFEDQTNGSNYVGIKAAASLAGNLTYTLPSAAPGASGYVLSSTTGGVMSWVAAPTSEIDATVQTTDATVTTIATVATSTDNAVYMVDASFFAIDPTAGHVYERGMRAVVYRNGASALSVANVNNYSTYADDVSWAATVDVSGTDIRLRVQGDATNATEWRVIGSAKEHA